MKLETGDILYKFTIFTHGPQSKHEIVRVTKTLAVIESGERFGRDYYKGEFLRPKIGHSSAFYQLETQGLKYKYEHSVLLKKIIKELSNNCPLVRLEIIAKTLEID